MVTFLFFFFFQQSPKLCSSLPCRRVVIGEKKIYIGSRERVVTKVLKIVMVVGFLKLQVKV